MLREQSVSTHGYGPACVTKISVLLFENLEDFSIRLEFSFQKSRNAMKLNPNKHGMKDWDDTA